MSALTVTRQDVSSGAALSLVQAAAAFAASKSLRICAVVADSSGRTVAMLRMDGVNDPYAEFAADKAYTAATTRRSTEEFYERMSSTPALALGFTNRNRLMVWGGGLPLFRTGVCVGGIGISGGTVSDDISCAEAALRELNWSASAMS